MQNLVYFIFQSSWSRYPFINLKKNLIRYPLTNYNYLNGIITIYIIYKICKINLNIIYQLIINNSIKDRIRWLSKSRLHKIKHVFKFTWCEKQHYNEVKINK